MAIVQVVTCLDPPCVYISEIAPTEGKRSKRQFFEFLYGRYFGMSFIFHTLSISCLFLTLDIGFV